MKSSPQEFEPITRSKPVALGDLVLIEYKRQEWLVVKVRKEIYIFHDKERKLDIDVIDVEIDFAILKIGIEQDGLWFKQPIAELRKAPQESSLGNTFPMVEVSTRS